MICVGVGQDSHRFLNEKSAKRFVIGGVTLDEIGLDADSDGDVILHAICNAITSITHVPILGDIAIKMCREGFTDSRRYVAEALKTLEQRQIVHIALTVELKKPRLQQHCIAIRQSVADILGIDASQVGLTCTSGNGLTDFGKGLGVQCFCNLTVTT